MLADILHKAEASSPSAAVIISIALMLFLAFLMTRVTKKLKLPNVTAYIITGILIGPYCLDFVPKTVVDGMDFLSDIALAFIAFSTGQFFRFSALKKNGFKVTVITLFEACFASAAIFILTYWILGLSLAFSIVLSALAATTAPASTMMTIRQTGAKGDFVDTLLQTVALDNIIGLLAYSIAISLASVSISGGSFSISDVLIPMASNIGVLLLGCVFGILMKPLLNQKRSTDNRLIIMIAFLFAFCGICVILDISPLLGCMSMGTVYFNITDDEKLFKQLNYFNPPILLLFFVRSGMCFDLSALMSQSSTVGAVSLLAVGILYFVIRIISKYCGAFLGCAVTKKDKKVRNNLGLALIPQAGVAIGLASLGARTLGGEAGDALQTIILSSSILYELIGPVCAKMSLHLSGSYSDKLEELVSISELNENGEKKTQLEMLIERIHKIQEELPKHTVTEDDEQAFTSAAEEQYENTNLNPNQLRYGRFKRR
ncbi:MAG: cation:proton antiporter [Clostridia bacterium]|nr:cation:proton antiporter [Clostridia bacterium]